MLNLELKSEPSLKGCCLIYPVITALYLLGTSISPTFAQALPTESIPFEQNSENYSIYLLGAGDQVDIAVYGYEEYTSTKTILPDGSIALPLVGNVMAAGKTTEQLSEELTQRLQSLLVNPVVTVSLTTFRPVVVNVAGEVMRPGPLQLRSLTTADFKVRGETVEPAPTLSAALIQAGGITQYADIRQITLRRATDGNSEPATINLWDMIASDNAPPDVVLQDGDSIFVPRLSDGNQLDRRLITRSTLAPTTVRVRVVGEVKNPGEVLVPPSSSVSSAVAIAGGATVDARLREVAFVRMNESGEVERHQLDLRNMTDNYQIQEGDVVIVPKQGSSAILDIAGRLAGPLSVLINLFLGI